MKKLSFLGIAFAAMLTFGLTSCSDDDNVTEGYTYQLSENEKELAPVLDQYVKATVQPTYAALADSCSQLYTQVLDLRDAAKDGQVKQEDVNKACETFLHARANYERSEAFLLGAADQFGIDPHIDSWPLDLTQLYNLLKSPNMINTLDFDRNDKDAENAAIAQANGNFGNSLLGFHGIEFILFRDGAPRKASELNGNDSYNKDGLNFTSMKGHYELLYATAVAGDLRDNVYRMECAWNENAPQAHKDRMDELEWGYTDMAGRYFSDNMINAGKAGSGYTSVKGAISAILVGDKGCVGIADEVGNTKINNPFSGADVNYIESPYSKNSKTDFQNNVMSIMNTWYGGVDKGESGQANGTRDNAKSLSAFFAKNYPEQGKAVENAMNYAKAKIKAMGGNQAFVDYIHQNGRDDATGEAAIAACKALSSALTTAYNAIK